MRKDVRVGCWAGLMAVLTVGNICADGGSLEETFRHPPAEARPHTWYHMMNGNVTKEGITADFEALAKIGIGGVQMFDAGCNIPPGPLAFNSPEWFEMFRHAAAEAKRLGLEICIPNCSGWSSSGGPWNMPSNGMKFVTYREVQAKGPSRFQAKLPREKNDHGYYEDIAVLAFPTPAADLVSFAGVKAKLEGTTALLTAEKPFEASGVSYQLAYPHIWGANAQLKIESAADGTTFQPVMTTEIPLSRSGAADYSVRFQALPKVITTRALRLTIANASVAVTIKVARPERKMAIANLGAKTFAVRQETKRDATVAAQDQTVAKGSVLNLTEKMSADGTLTWDVPAGAWTIVRLGAVCNGRRNHPASDHGVGLEVDKLSAAAMDYHFNQYVARLCRTLGSLAGDVPAGFNNILVDSYEVGSQNWTQNLDKTFAARMGYSLVPYLPVFAGHVVGSVDESERFLEDFRRVVADLFAENYAGALAAKCHEYGLKLSLEPYGSCPADNLQYGEKVDIPMGEFWSNAGNGEYDVGEGNARFPAYVAHVWGKKFVGTESFTANPVSGGRWQTTPFSIKAQGDRVFARGVNRIIYHRFTHQPWTSSIYLPGMTMGRWGMHFDRTQTWWPYAEGWIAYQTRCQALLQAGEFVADALFFCGEQAPNQGGNTDGGAKVSMKLPDGYAWDVCPKDAFMKLRVADGRVIVPGGLGYRLLVLPATDTMSAAVLRKVDELLAAGAKICGVQKPTRSPGLVGYPQADSQVAAAAEKIWAKGVMTLAPAKALEELGVVPDFQVSDVPFEGPLGVAYIHRRNPGADWYFVAMPNRQAVRFEASFREVGRVPEIWQAETGAIADAGVWRVENGRTIVTLDFDVSGSAFVVFRRPVGGDHVTKLSVKARPFPRLTGGETVEIVKAEYGAFEMGKVVDFTARLKSKAKNGVISVVIGNALAGKDPIYLTPKVARITYRLNGRERHAELRENAVFVVPPSAQDAFDLPAAEVASKRLCAAEPLTAKVTFASGKTQTVSVQMPAPVQVAGPWHVSFPNGFRPNALAKGAPEELTFTRLEDWIDRPEEGVKYFSGTATYRNTVPVTPELRAALAKGARVMLDLGRVKEVAAVTVNGVAFPPLWKPPFRVDVTDVLKGADEARLDVRVANLWANRLIGDDRTCADDCEWVGKVQKGVKEIGIKGIPDWVKAGKPSPTGRMTFTTWKHWDKNDQLLPSGLLGPVCLRTVVPCELD